MQLCSSILQTLALCAIGLDLISLVAGGTITLSVRPVKRLRHERSINNFRGIETHKFPIGIISDLDAHSKRKNTAGMDQWISYMRTGSLRFTYQEHSSKKATINITWDEGKEGNFLAEIPGLDGRAMEFSELIRFRNDLLTCDDQTGIVYKLYRSAGRKDTQVWNYEKWIQLPSSVKRGYKCEWATAKNGKLWIGSNGNRKGTYEVHEIDHMGNVTTHDWYDNYRKMAAAVEVFMPTKNDSVALVPWGYVTHEAAGWDRSNRRWVFIPRKVSQFPYDAEQDIHHGSNQVITADFSFTNVTAKPIAGQLMPELGASSFKWIPLRETNNRYIVALKTKEAGNEVETHVLAFDVDGKVLFPETKIEDSKYEGIVFL